MLKRVPKWSFRYVVLVEAIYVLYELLLFKNPGQDNMSALALGLLLAALTMPTSAILFYVVVYAAQWLGYTGGEARDFLPRMLSVQIPMFLNAAAIWWLTRSTKAHKMVEAVHDET